MVMGLGLLGAAGRTLGYRLQPAPLLVAGCTCLLGVCVRDTINSPCPIFGISFTGMRSHVLAQGFGPQ